jgi:cytochrome c
MKFVPHATALVSALALAVCSLAAHASTRDEAQTMLKAALAEIKTKGIASAGEEFTANGAAWNKGSLYVFVADFKANIVAHAANSKMVGKNLWEVKDASGKLFVQDQVRQMQAGASGTVSMRWMNPATKQLGDAEVLLGRVPGQEAYVGAVYFK